MLVIDWSISIGNIGTMVLVFIGAMSVAFSMRYDVRQLKTDVNEVKEELKELKNVAVELATQTTMATLAQQRMDRIQRQLESLEARFWNRERSENR